MNILAASLKTADIVFFIIFGLIVLAIVLIVILTPIFNKKKYMQQQEALKLREKAYKESHPDLYSDVASNESTKNVVDGNDK